jgi:hypothetical protein
MPNNRKLEEHPGQPAMDREEQPPPSHLERLSVELRQMILSALPDAATLRSAVLSCPAFYFAFQGAESSISTPFLLSQVGIDIDLLPNAIAALESLGLSRFEIYRNLFRDSAQGNAGVTRQQDELFFDIEQLGCIHDFVVRSVWPGKSRTYSSLFAP